MLDPAGYGPLTITQSLSIVNDGVGTASITVPANATGITVAAGANDRVHLRGIEIDGNGTSGTVGVTVTSVGALDIFNSVIRHTDLGLASGTSGAPKVRLIDTIVSDNASQGIQFSAGVLTIDRSTITGNYQGVLTGGSARMTMERSIVSGNTDGVDVNGSSIDFIRDCNINGNSAVGVSSGGAGAAVMISHNIIAHNGVGIKNNSGQFNTYKDNNVNFNTTDAQGSINTYGEE